MEFLNKIIEQENFMQIFILFATSIILARLSYPVFGYLISKIEKRLLVSLKTQEINLSKSPYTLLVLCAIWYKILPLLSVEQKWIEFFRQPLLIILGCSIIAISYQFVDLLSIYVETLLKKENNKDAIRKNLLSYSKRIIKVAIAIIAIIIILQNAGMNVSSLIASLGIGGVAIALAAKETLGNLFGSLSIIIDKPFTVGDWICCGEHEGTVEDIGFRSTKIKTFYDSVITLPNSMVADSVIDNLGRRQSRRARFTLDVTYDTSPETIESFVKGITEILKSNEFVRQDYFQVYFSGYAASSLQIFVNLFLKVNDWDEELLQKQKIFLEILKLSKKLNIDFAFPTQTLDIPKGLEVFKK